MISYVPVSDMCVYINNKTIKFYLNVIENTFESSLT